MINKRLFNNIKKSNIYYFVKIKKKFFNKDKTIFSWQ